jgi:hypothetical protein
VSRHGIALVICAGTALGATSVFADDHRFGIDGQIGYTSLTSADQSARAIFDGSSGGITYGGGLRYVFARGFYVGAWGRYFSKTGERVFIADASGPVFRLGHPLKVRIVPIQLTVGYRFGRDGFVIPYLGAGGGLTRYHEESEVAGAVESNDQTKASGHILAGVEVGRGSVRVGAEAGYAFVPNTIGIGGVSQIYGENDIGGFTVVGKVVFSFGSR